MSTVPSWEIDSDYQYMSGMPGGYSHDGLKEIESTLSWLEENLRSPQINCLEGWGIPAEPPDSPENQRWMRVITTLSLTHSDGYVMYNTGWGSVAVCPECPYPCGDLVTNIYGTISGTPTSVNLSVPKFNTAKTSRTRSRDCSSVNSQTGGLSITEVATPQTITLPASATPVSDRGNNAASTKPTSSPTSTAKYTSNSPTLTISIVTELSMCLTYSLSLNTSAPLPVMSTATAQRTSSTSP